MIGDASKRSNPAADPGAWDLFVFRKNRESLNVRNLSNALYSELLLLGTEAGSPLDALVRAGEIESGLADSNRSEARPAAELTDALAEVALGVSHLREYLVGLLDKLPIDTTIRCSHPEGFSYYGLNPLDFADLVFRIRRQLRPRLAIIGIRSVGTTLGAVVKAALAAAGTKSERISVRPEGEPYHRLTKFSSDQLEWIRANLASSAEFLIVDEGPGFSGSTFLSVIGALTAAGVPRDGIVMLCSRPFSADPNRPSQASEWAKCRSFRVDYGRRLPPEAGVDVGSGLWRTRLYERSEHWPACWTELERIKHLSRDELSLFKFEGFGRFSQLVTTQAEILAQGGYGPALLQLRSGYGQYSFIDGCPLRAHDISQGILSRFAGYCAFRAKSFVAGSADNEAITKMLDVNLALGFGQENMPFALPLERPVFPDCRMHPHEWLATRDGKIIKTDGAGHADDHQFPGPTDIAWDMAGLIVDWDLPDGAVAYLLAEYGRLTSDAIQKRIRPYLLAYTVFRAAYFRMGAAAMALRPEFPALRSAYCAYEKKARLLLKTRAAAASS